MATPTQLAELTNIKKMRCRGDEADADVWLQIIVAIGEFRKPPTNTRM